MIGAPLREELKGLGGFRNILVHGYLRVDPDRVARSLQVSPTPQRVRAGRPGMAREDDGVRRARRSF